ncbi:MAG: beta-N-acetylglucosaminidase domain-containing protein [Acidimicrobiales bacterium]|nr:beta-N-acetylglucosaminidase domain-containing protein [Acidimicrobiales bacterium]
MTSPSATPAATVAGPVAGLVEGFYGRPWTWDERVEVLRRCAARGMTHYVYAPKDDPRHRAEWREPYGREALDGFRRLVAESGLVVGFGISPGLSVDARSRADRDALLAKVDQALSVGVGLVCLALDDIPERPGLGEEHAELTIWLRDRLAGRAGLVLVPTEYVGVRSTPYLDALATIPTDVLIGWTGTAVVNDTITAAEARGRAASLGGRPPLLWDNYPVNDAVMGDRLFLGPLRGRGPALLDACGGYLANPMVQPRASTLPLASVAAWLRGEDPVAAWAEEADALGWRTFAEACDGEVPRRLVAAVAAAAPGAARDAGVARLRSWLTAAAECEAPGLEDEAGPWLDQVHAEAALGRRALDVLEAAWSPAGREAGGAGALGALAIATRWPSLRRSAVSVLGPRCSFRPVLGQGRHGGWAYRAESLQEDLNALDHLVRLALRQLAETAGAA